MSRVIAAVTLSFFLALSLFAGGSGSAATTQRADVGAFTLSISKQAGKKLRKARISVGGRKLKVPIAEGTTGALAQMTLAGSLRFEAKAKRKAKRGGKKRRTRGAKFRGLAAVVSANGSYVTGRLKGRQYTLFELRGVGEAPFNPITGALAVQGARLTMPSLVRDAVAERLRTRKPPRKLGTADASATLEAVEEEETSPPVRTRPGTAVDIDSATVTWRARESWVDYLSDAPGDLGGAAGTDGAVDGPAETIPPSQEPRVYEWSFPFAEGWYDAGSDTAQVEMEGTVNYFKMIDPFQIDLDATAPEVELGGPTPRLIGTLFGRRNSSDQQNRRAVLVDLDQEAVTPDVTNGPGGTTYTYDEIPALVPEGSDTWPVAGYYQPGDNWGSLSVSFTVTP